MKKNKSVPWHFDFTPVSKKESERITRQIKDGIPSNMFVIRGNKIYCGGKDTGGGGHPYES